MRVVAIGRAHATGARAALLVKLDRAITATELEALEAWAEASGQGCAVTRSAPDELEVHGPTVRAVEALAGRLVVETVLRDIEPPKPPVPQALLDQMNARDARERLRGKRPARDPADVERP